MVDEVPKAKAYFSDGWDAYALLWYHSGCYQVSMGKSDTYPVEAGNAESRHYLARLARLSRCFSRCPHALECALRLFVYCFNSRQLRKRKHPATPFIFQISLAHLFNYSAPSYEQSNR